MPIYLIKGQNFHSSNKHFYLKLKSRNDFFKLFCCSLKKRDAMDYGDQMVGDDNSYYDRPFKTEPEDFEDDEINDEDYYPNHTNDIATRNVGRGEISLSNISSSKDFVLSCCYGLVSDIQIISLT